MGGRPTSFTSVAPTASSSSHQTTPAGGGNGGRRASPRYSASPSLLGRSRGRRRVRLGVKSQPAARSRIGRARRQVEVGALVRSARHWRDRRRRRRRRNGCGRRRAGRKSVEVKVGLGVGVARAVIVWRRRRTIADAIDQIEIVDAGVVLDASTSSYGQSGQQVVHRSWRGQGRRLRRLEAVRPHCQTEQSAARYCRCRRRRSSSYPRRAGRVG